MTENQINSNLADETKSFHDQIDEIRSIAEESLHYVKAMYQSKTEGLGKDEPDLKSLVQENLNLSHEIYRLTKKIKNQLLWQKIFGVIKLLIIVVPLVVGSIFLYPYAMQMIETYQQITETAKTGSIIDTSKLSPEMIQNLLKQIKK